MVEERDRGPAPVDEEEVRRWIELRERRRVRELHAARERMLALIRAAYEKGRDERPWAAG